MPDAAFIAEWVKGKTAADYDLLEHDGRVLWPDKLRRLRKAKDTGASSGKPAFEEIPVCVRVLRYDEELDAVGDARRIFEDRGLNYERQGALYEQLEMLSKVARAIREPTAPHGQFQTVDALISPKETGIDTRELYGVWQRLELYGKLQDPRLAEIDEIQAVQLAFAVAEARNLSPLVAIAGSDVDNCVISMAVALVNCLRNSSSAQSHVKSMQGRSRSKS